MGVCVLHGTVSCLRSAMYLKLAMFIGSVHRCWVVTKNCWGTTSDIEMDTSYLLYQISGPIDVPYALQLVDTAVHIHGCDCGPAIPAFRGG